MRPPMLYLTIAFAAGLAAALNPYVVCGASYVVLPILIGALVLQRRAAVAAACGVMLVAGVVWGAAAVREQRASCAGQHARAAIVRLTDPAPGAGGVVEASVLGGPCRGTLTIRWPPGHPAHGGTTWVIAGRFLGDARRSVLVARRVRELDAVPRGRGALRDSGRGRS